MAGGGRCGLRAALVRNVTKAVCGTAWSFFGFRCGASSTGSATGTACFHPTTIWSRTIPFLIAGPSGLLLTIVFIMRSPDRLRLGDRLAGTVVVRRRAVSSGARRSALRDDGGRR